MSPRPRRRPNTVANVIYSMTVSLDGFVADAAGELDWGAPDEELHRFHNEETRKLGAHLCGRRLYETMSYWDTAEPWESPSAVVREFADIWQAVPKIVFSTTLESVQGNATLATRPIAEELAAAKAQGGGDVGVGGAGLAAELTALGLIDEYRLFVKPVVLGGGTPYLPPVRDRITLELRETRTFGGGVVYLRCARP